VAEQIVDSVGVEIEVRHANSHAMLRTGWLSFGREPSHYVSTASGIMTAT
jgi:hypothetical protein